MKLVENLRRINKVHIVLILSIALVFNFFLLHIVQAMTAQAAEPGTEENPLVSQDYVDSKISSLEAKVNSLTTKLNKAISDNSRLSDELAELAQKNETLEQKNEALEQKTESLEKKLQEQGTTAPVPGFEIIQVPAGKQVICDINTEFIIRGGTTRAIAGASGGIADLTSGTDLKQDVVIPMNHHILVPKDDGRGFKVVTDSWVLIKGNYEIK